MSEAMKDYISRETHVEILRQQSVYLEKVHRQKIEAQAKEIAELKKKNRFIRSSFENLYHSTLNCCAGFKDFLKNENVTDETKKEMEVLNDWLIQKCKEFGQ